MALPTIECSQSSTPSMGTLSSSTSTCGEPRIQQVALVEEEAAMSEDAQLARVEESPEGGPPNQPAEEETPMRHSEEDQLQNDLLEDRKNSDNRPSSLVEDTPSVESTPHTNSSVPRSVSSFGCSPMGRSQAYRRILREFEEIQNAPSELWTAAPLDLEHPYEFHFTLRGTPDSEFEEGVYHGRIVLPVDYPRSPPDLIFLTPNGRFETGKKVCLSATAFHPELWQPAWGISTLMDALGAFLETSWDGAVGALDWPADVRRQLATRSRDWVCPTCNAKNTDLLEGRPTAPSGALSTSAAVPTDSSSCATAEKGGAGAAQRPLTVAERIARRQPKVHTAVPASSASEVIPLILQSARQRYLMPFAYSTLRAFFRTPETLIDLTALILNYGILIFAVLYAMSWKDST